MGLDDSCGLDHRLSRRDPRVLARQRLGERRTVQRDRARAIRNGGCNVPRNGLGNGDRASEYKVVGILVAVVISKREHRRLSTRDRGIEANDEIRECACGERRWYIGHDREARTG